MVTPSRCTALLSVQLVRKHIQSYTTAAAIFEAGFAIAKTFFFGKWRRIAIVPTSRRRVSVSVVSAPRSGNS